MAITVEKSGASCGAFVTGVDLTQEISADLAGELRAIWLENKVIAFPDQQMSDADLERFTLAFGEFGEDPFFGHIDGHENIAAIQRNADEETPIFAEFFHSDWSFLEVPPAGFPACSVLPFRRKAAIRCLPTRLQPMRTCLMKSAIWPIVLSPFIRLSWATHPMGLMAMMTGIADGR